MAAAISPAMLVLGQGLLIGMVPVFNVAVLSYRLTVTPDALQGRVNGVARLMANVCTPLGTAAGGVLLQLLGPRVELWLIAAGLGLSALTTGFTDVRRA
jgi:predicted MFS family arabinose efflux permease